MPDGSIASSLGNRKVFEETLKRRCPECTITNADTQTFPRAAFDSGKITPKDLLQRLVDTNTRIAFVATYGLPMRQLFAASARENMLHGPGYAWLSPDLQPSAYSHSNGTLDPDAAKGIEGLFAARSAKKKHKSG